MSSGAKKEKSFNGTKAKFSPNPAVSEKKADVKLRRKESEKVKQPSDSNRKSVFGRFFHNLVDSDDSRKKAASADAKKKKGRDAGSSDLDLPEHGFVFLNTQTLQRDQPNLPNARARASTLSNQSRDSRNRWSSYDIQACNFTEGALPPTVPETDYSTLGHRSLSEETLNASLSSDSRPLSKITDGFINHSDSARQPDAMRKHAQLLQSIQETKTIRPSRSDKTSDVPVGQSSNGYCLTTEMVIDGQKKDTSITGHSTDQKLNDLQKASSCDSTDGNRELRPKHETTASSSDALVLLNEKSKQIDKALADKRRILSQLFSVTEEDLNHLLETNVDLSADMSIRKMILISLLQSDRLTSAISGLLVPTNDACTDGAADKEAAAAKGDKCHEDKTSSQSQLLHDVTFRLHGHLTLLQQMMDKDVAETSRLKKDLEETQQKIRIKSMPAEAKLDLSEVTPSSDEVAQHNPDLSVSTEEQGNESMSNTVDNTTDNVSNQETQPTENKDLSKDVSIPDEKQTAKESFPLVGELPDNAEHTNSAQLSSADTDVMMDVKLPSHVSQNISPCIDTVIAEIHIENKVIVLSDKDTLSQQQECIPSCEIKEEFTAVPVSSGKNLNDVVVPAEVKEDNQTDLQDVNDEVKEFVDEAAEMSDLYHSDSNRKFMNLESIPEDDDRLICCDVEQKVSASKNLDQELLVKEVTVPDDIQIVAEDSTTLNAEGEAQLNLKYDTRSNVEVNMQSNFTEGLRQSAGGEQSEAADDLQFSFSDAHFQLGDDLLSKMLDDLETTVEIAPSGVQDDVPFSVTDTPLHTGDDTRSSAAVDPRSDIQDDTQSGAADDTQSDAQDDTRSSAIDEPRSNTPDDTQCRAIDDPRSVTQDDTRSDTEDDHLPDLDELQTEVLEGEGSCQSEDPAVIADVDFKSDSDQKICQGLESMLTEGRSPEIYDLARPENLESSEKENLEIEAKQESLETDTETKISMLLENDKNTESETDGELESEDDRSSEPGVLDILEPSLLELEPEENLDWEAERLPVESGYGNNEQMLDEPENAHNELTELGEISATDIFPEERQTAEINEPKTVVEGLLHNHVQSKSDESGDGFSLEKSKSEIAEVVSELLDLSECDKIALVSSEGE